MPRLKITYKMAIILATMSFGPLVAGGITGMIPLEDQSAQTERKELGRQLAANCSAFLSNKDNVSLQKACRAAVKQNEELKSIRIVRYDGMVLYASPDHVRYWTLGPEAPDDINQMRVPLQRGASTWAEMEIAFSPISTSFLSGTGKWALVILLGFGMNAISFAFFLNKSFKALDPKNAVPQRVRNTLDTIVGGVVILDKDGKILLANDSFARSVNRSADDLMGSSLSQLPWRTDNNQERPWEPALRENTQIAAIKVHLQVGENKELSFVVNATPVLDGSDAVSGALVSFEDITVMEKQRIDLLQAMNDLETSKEQIRRQNEELHELASRDGLTGALNRRALFEKIDAIWKDRNQKERGLITIMMDVDHFKKLNDQHGHSAGDSVLKQVVTTVQRTIGQRGTLGRYGGEEFCVIMESATVGEGASLAEEIRAGIQEFLADPYKVTASIGVSSSLFGAPSIQNQIEQADQALYAAKHGGRNTVRTWTPELEAEAKEAELKKTAKLSSLEIEEHPISYHAVVTLNAALAHRAPTIAAHSHRVAEMSVALARNLMPVGSLYTLEIAAVLHDIGVIGVPDSFSIDSLHSMDDTSPSTRAENVHTGCEIAKAAFNSLELMEILQYHNTPYNDPGEVSGQAIPIGARIVAIVDAYDSMVSELSDNPCSHDEAVERLRALAGTQFDPELVQRFADSPFGWRPFNPNIDTGMTDQHAVMIGYQLERVIHSFDSRNPVVLKSRLLTLQDIAKSIDMPVIAHIIQELAGEAERKAVADWDSLLPMLQDLIEVCLTIQRAYLRTVNRSAVSV